MLASLQMAIRDEAMDTEKNTAAEMLHGANNVNLRKQVCAFVYFVGSKYAGWRRMVFCS